VGNYGTGPTDMDSWWDRLVLSDDDAFGDADDKYLTSIEHNGILEKGDQYTEVVNVRLPIGISGDYWVFVQTDETKNVFEYIYESNNISQSALPVNVTLTDYADLTVKDLINPGQGVVGEFVSLTWTVSNSGSGITGDGTPEGIIDNWTDRIVLSPNVTYGDSDDRVLAEVAHNDSLAENESYIGSWTGILPSGLSGTYHVFVYADSKDQVFEYTNPLSNLAAGETTITIASLVLGKYAWGAIESIGEKDEWTFFGRSGRAITAVVNTGSISPAASAPFLSWAQVKVLDTSGKLLTETVSSSEGQVLKLNEIILPDDGVYKIQVRAPSGHTSVTGNYLISVWDVTADVYSLVPDQQFLGKIETPYSLDHWNFTAAEGQQVKFDLINASASGLAFSLNGPDGWKGFENINADSELITLPVTGAYFLTASATSDQIGISYTFRLIQTTQTTLTTGSAYEGTLSGSGQAQLFHLELSESSPLLVKLNDTSNNNHNELYLKFALPPTRSVYDYRYSVAAGADQQILVPMAFPGTWSMLIMYLQPVNILCWRLHPVSC
jgi:hypothetical protein